MVLLRRERAGGRMAQGAHLERGAIRVCPLSVIVRHAYRSWLPSWIEMNRPRSRLLNMFRNPRGQPRKSIIRFRPVALRARRASRRRICTRDCRSMVGLGGFRRPTRYRRKGRRLARSSHQLKELFDFGQSQLRASRQVLQEHVPRPDCDPVASVVILLGVVGPRVRRELPRDSGGISIGFRFSMQQR